MSTTATTAGIAVPRLRPGQYLKGPDYAGCMNSGLQPVIHHTRSGAYLVGPEEALGEAIRAQRREPWRRVLHVGRRVVRIYRTRGPAVRRFKTECVAVVNANAETRAQAAALRAMALRGDVGAALALGDLA